MLVVGAPLRTEGGLFNTAVVIHRGRVLGVVPKSYLPEYREYYEKRQFRAARDAIASTISLLGAEVPFGSELLFADRSRPNFIVHVEICEDVWAPIPPSSYAALAGATVLANLSASNITVGKADYRTLLGASQSARAIAAYIFTAAGLGESTTDLAWDGQAMIYENGDLLAEAERFAERRAADHRRHRPRPDRRRPREHQQLRRRDPRPPRAPAPAATDRVRVRRRRPAPVSAAAGRTSASPTCRSDPAGRNERCEEVYNIQVRGLETRLRATGDREGRDRRLRRPGLDPRADRRGPRA